MGVHPVQNALLANAGTDVVHRFDENLNDRHGEYCAEYCGSADMIQVVPAIVENSHVDTHLCK